MQQVGPLAELMQVRALLYSNRYLTDGHIPVSVLETLARGFSIYRENGGRVKAVSLAEKLVDAGVWEQVADGFLIHDYADYQPARVKVLAARTDAKARMKKSRGSQDVRPNTDQSSPEVRPKFSFPVPVPVPVPVEASSKKPSPHNSHLGSDELDSWDWLEAHGMPVEDRRLFLDDLRAEGNRKHPDGLHSLDAWAMKPPAPGIVHVLEERFRDWQNAQWVRDKHQSVANVPGFEALAAKLRMPAA